MLQCKWLSNEKKKKEHFKWEGEMGVPEYHHNHD